jgi:hypothetical protein
MSYPAAPSQPVASSITARRTHVPDAVRAAMVLVGLGVFTSFTLLNEHLIFSAFGWVVYLGTMGLGLVAAARILLVDAPTPTDGPMRVERTRQISVFKEIAIAGGGAVIAAGSMMYPIAASSQEMWAGRVREGSDLSLPGLVFALLFALMGVVMVAFRPQFVLDRAAGTIVRYPFARSLPLGAKTMSYADLTVYSEGYFWGNTGQRMGDVIRGRVGKYTFELEMVHGNQAPEYVQPLAMRWAAALGARYLGPAQAAAAELPGGSD